MAAKQTRVSRRILFTWLMLAGFIFLFAPDKWTNKLQLVFACIFHRPLSVGRSFSLSMQMQGPVAQVVSRSQYSMLQNHLANTIEWLNQERQKVEKLSGLRDRPVWKGANFVLADVITTSIGASHGRLIINRGQTDGLAKDQFVLGDYSIIGTVSDVDARTAQVTLITDPTSKVAVKTAKSIQSNTSRSRPSDELQDAPLMIMQGSGNNSAKIELLPAKYKVEVGDVVYAQKKPGFLEIPMITARVTWCKRDDENPLLWDITAEPACDIEKLKDVTVIIMNPQE
ncbi:MAG TPA: rod shape-determining protein MreC [Sedimentisphaerales bacterium]|nr:rod shape-determining protein MreC [Sedimentisphaerales bacterium]